MKKTKLVALFTLIITVAISLAGCSNINYHKDVNKYSLWENDITEAIPQPNIGLRVREFLKEPLKKGKTVKKVAFIGYDGCRADMMLNLPKSDDNTINTEGSAINTLLSNSAKIYLTYAGGNIGKNKQHTSTGPGWSTLTSGVWGDKHGVTDNKMVKSIKYKTFMLEAAIGEGYPKKYSSTFAASWSEHFWIAYKEEYDYVRSSAGLQKRECKDNNELKAYLNEIGDRAKGNNVDMRHRFVKDDEELLTYMKACLTDGNILERDIVFGIFEGTDHAGHSYGFSNDVKEYVLGFKDEESKALELLNTIYSRPNYASEDWLIIITTDHGGYKTGHGGQTMEERTTWAICNQGIDKKYYSKNYNGKKAN